MITGSNHIAKLLDEAFNPELSGNEKLNALKKAFNNMDYSQGNIFWFNLLVSEILIHTDKELRFKTINEFKEYINEIKTDDLLNAFINQLQNQIANEKIEKRGVFFGAKPEFYFYSLSSKQLEFQFGHQKLNFENSVLMIGSIMFLKKFFNELFSKLDESISKIKKLFKGLEIKSYGITVSYSRAGASYDMTNNVLYLHYFVLKYYSMMVNPELDNKTKEFSEVKYSTVIIHELAHELSKKMFQKSMDAIESTINTLISLSERNPFINDYLMASTELKGIFYPLTKLLDIYFKASEQRLIDSSSDLSAKASFEREIKKYDEFKKIKDLFDESNKLLDYLNVPIEKRKETESYVKFDKNEVEKLEKVISKEDREFIIRLPYNIAILFFNVYTVRMVIYESPAILSEFIYLINYARMKTKNYTEAIEEAKKLINVLSHENDFLMTRKWFKTNKLRRLYTNYINSTYRDSDYKIYGESIYPQLRELLKRIEKTGKIEETEDFESVLNMIKQPENFYIFLRQESNLRHKEYKKIVETYRDKLD